MNIHIATEVAKPEHQAAFNDAVRQFVQDEHNAGRLMWENPSDANTLRWGKYVGKDAHGAINAHVAQQVPHLLMDDIIEGLERARANRKQERLRAAARGGRVWPWVVGGGALLGAGLGGALPSLQSTTRPTRSREKSHV